MPHIENIPVNIFTTFGDSVVANSPYNFRITNNSETLHASIPEFVRVEVPRPIRRYYNSFQNTRAPSRNLDSLSSGSDTASTALDVVQSASRSINNRTSTQSNFDPETFDPASFTFKETYNKLSTCNLDNHSKFVRDTILKYSLSISGFPPCPDEDLMLAVFFYFEEKFNIEAKFELCIRFNNHNQKNLVGVIFDTIQAKEDILKEAARGRRSKIKIMRNGAFHWILDGFCGR